MIAAACLGANRPRADPPVPTANPKQLAAPISLLPQQDSIPIEYVILDQSYNARNQSERSTRYVDKIMKGANPADLPGGTADQVRVGHQSQDGKSARPHHPGLDPGPRRQGHRVSNCDLVPGGSLIDLVASRLALRAPALRAATAMIRPPSPPTAHYWARELGALGHEVRLMPAQYVKAYIKRTANSGS